MESHRNCSLKFASIEEDDRQQARTVAEAWGKLGDRSGTLTGMLWRWEIAQRLWKMGTKVVCWFEFKLGWRFYPTRLWEAGRW